MRASPCVTKYPSALPNQTVTNQLQTSQRQRAAISFPFHPLMPYSDRTPRFIPQQVHVVVCSIRCKAHPMEIAKSNSNKTNSGEKNESHAYLLGLGPTQYKL